MSVTSFFRAQRRLVVWSVLILLLAAGWCWLNRGAISEYLVNYQNRNKLREEVGRLQREGERLREERDMLSRGGFEQEKAARERLRYSGPDENVLYLEYPGQATKAPVAPSPSPTNTPSATESPRPKPAKSH